MDTNYEPKLTASWKTKLQYFVGLLGKIIFWLFWLWIALWVYSAVSDSRYATRVYVPVHDHYDVIAFGDSLVEGLGSRDIVGIVGRLEQMTGAEILNMGHRGDTTADLVRRIDSDVIAKDPKIVMIIVGGNDAVRFVPEAEVLANIEILFKKLRTRNITVLFGEVTDNVLYSGRNKKLSEIADRYGVVYVPGLMEGVFWTLTNKFDPLHPDDAGYQKMANRMAPYLQKVLPTQSLPDIAQ
jgi:lysophospholipase L1-like esterase